MARTSAGSIRWSVNISATSTHFISFVKVKGCDFEINTKRDTKFALQNIFCQFRVALQLLNSN